jgi:MarR family transcriptional regulator, 2-MHQ and catechol-resistance regulon repressor
MKMTRRKSRYPGTRAEVRALDAWIKLNRAVESVAGSLRKAIEAAGLTMGQFGVLEALTYVGPLTPSEIARRVLRSQANITTVLDNLEREGLVERKRSTADRRVVTVHATASGRRQIERVMPAHVRGIKDALSALSPREQESLAALCKKLGLANAGKG